MAQPRASRWRQPPGSSRQGVAAPGQAGHVEHKGAPGLELLARETVDAAEEADVLIDGAPRKPLRHVADAALDSLGIAADVDAADQRNAPRTDGNPHSMRIVVDLPAPFAPRKPKISPCFTENDRLSTATNDPNRRERPRTSIAAVGTSGTMRTMRTMALPTHRAFETRFANLAFASARVLDSSTSSSATCATSTSVLVATPAANRSATTRRASPRFRTASRAALTIALAVSTSRRRCWTSAVTRVSSSASRSLVATPSRTLQPLRLEAVRNRRSSS